MYNIPEKIAKFRENWKSHIMRMNINHIPSSERDVAWLRRQWKDSDSAGETETGQHPS